MGSSLVICEKPKQAKDIKAAVGTRFGEVLPAVGHLLTLKEPDDVRTEWAEKWSAELLWPGKFYEKKPVLATKKYLDAIRAAASRVDQIIIATDCDREGQLIGDEIIDFIGFRGKVLRAMFVAQDKKTLQQAFDNLTPNSQWRGLYMSGQAREQADQTTNLSLTRTATVTLKRPGSKGAIGIGRVKTPVLGIVCARELEIQNFKPQDMFEVDATTKVAAGSLVLSCSKLPKSLIKEQAAAQDDLEEEEEDLGEDGAALAEQENTSGRIMRRDIADGLRASVEGSTQPIRAKSERKKQGPPKLFDMTALQVAASSKLGWSGAKTLEVAQKLYSERTIITYPRGEAKYLPENNIAEVPALCAALLGLPNLSGYRPLVATPQVRKGKSGHFCDAALNGMSHYAIIPNANMADSFARIVPELSQDETRLWDIISRQYLAALAPDHEYQQTVIEMTHAWKGHDWEFRTSGRVPLVPGWKMILGSAGAKDKDDGPELPAVKSGEAGSVTAAALRALTTKPPARYTEGSLLKVMQEAWRLVPDPAQRKRLKDAKGIGTPATRGDVLKGLIAQGQLIQKGKSLMPTEGGMKLYDVLMKVCPNVVDPARTAIWETLFDMVEKGTIDANAAVQKILAETTREIERIKQNAGVVSIEIGKAGKPTPKMIAAAKSVAERKGIKLPPKCTTDSGVCRSFLEAHLPKRDPNAPAGVYPPSEKQVQFAERISGEIGKPIPAEARASSKALSAWIDTHKPKGGSGGGGAGRPPSEKQISFATKLAEENNVPLPDTVKKDMRACSEFIDKMMKSGGGKKKTREKA